MDGLLLDTKPSISSPCRRRPVALGREMPLDCCHSMIGVPTRECNVMIQAFDGDDFQVDAFRQHYSGHARRLLETSIPLKPGVVELLDFLAGRGLPLAVATSAGRNTADTISAAPACSSASTWWPRATTSSTPTASRRLSRGGAPAGRGARTLHRLRGFERRPQRRPAAGAWPSWCPTPRAAARKPRQVRACVDRPARVRDDYCGAPLAHSGHRLPIKRARWPAGERAQRGTCKFQI